MEFQNTEFFTFEGKQIASVKIYFGATYKDGIFVKSTFRKIHLLDRSINLVGNGNNRLLEVLSLHSGGSPECAGTRHIASVGGGFRSIGWHGVSRWAKDS
jgi:hypothetical protein